MKLIYKSLLSVMIIMLSTTLSAQDFSERLVYEDHFGAPEGYTLEMSNKYGDIEIFNWDKDSISIRTELILTSTSHANLRKLKENVKIKYDERDSRIIAYTSFNDNASEVLTQLQEFTKSIIPNQMKRIEANYTVYLPKHINLKVRQQYGDILMDDISGNVNIELFNGALSANRLSGSSFFELRYAKANINQINDGNFELIYSNLDLQKAISLNLESKISDIHIQELGVFKMNSTRDEINIENLAYLYGESTYSELRINTFTNELNCDMTYGQIDINRIEDSSSSIEIHSDRTDINLYTSPTVEYSYDITYHQDAMVRLPFENNAELIDYREERVFNTRGKTSLKTTPLNITLKAYKRCLIRIQDTFN